MREKQGQSQNTDPGCKTLTLADHLATRKGGWFHIEWIDGRTVVTVHRPSAPTEVIFCLSPGHANQVRQSLTDAGLAGLVEGSL
ncbi:hypothetical protein SAMN05421641_13128 [Paracoccus thiocyanatus]|uniref:Uncharacterized protein n=1 Tax=Paracoccus thiocyanatus TaxID=34006 RepID=A0A1N6Z6V6_9RHOB|nr:hypothetical protein [Paracoccus thiocyanatus]SIR22592.1 hypothetical protein SAMN05421641_13128 [Paracoccus thiocyanatus]